ncbi:MULTISPECIES: hypothetical protein [unclassified Polaribacter]|uniref:hypothetical protein n=1 Tax=unclassified Polaribacter TaxID=196858 RepID=UPI0011BFC7CA|nr:MULTISPECIES: hypothetical protein [unclassified Polaribacter]TXD51493.1 hypothetical protein ES043_11910 [Polaribacter sp. IC063]TXD61779.1 hypothetical protein ES044_03410 [Polaribacter sp. IC066]
MSIQFVKTKEDIYLNIPIIKQVKFLFDLIRDQKELKLTNKGFLPTKIVAELYKKGYIKDYLIEQGISKLYKETDSPSIHLAKILVELSTLVKKRNNKLSLTKKGIDQIDDYHKLFKTIFETFTTKFNWAYFDGFSNDEVGQSGFGFTLILLEKYGKEYRSPEFYADKYLNAFNFETRNDALRFADNPETTYMVRTFRRFLDYFGFIEFENDERNSKIRITKTFAELIKIQAHKTI